MFRIDKLQHKSCFIAKLVRRRNASRNGGEKANAELDDSYRPTVPFGCVAGTQRTVA